MTDPSTVNEGKDSRLSSEELIAELYGQLRHLAAARIARVAHGQTLQATALVHEAYLRLSTGSSEKWENRAHFFASASEAMRRILIDQARRKAAWRNGGRVDRVPLQDLDVSGPEPDDRLLAIHEVLDELAAENPALAELVKLRFFVGLKHHEVAALLDVSEKTARRQWDLAKIWLHQRITAKKSLLT